MPTFAFKFHNLLFVYLIVIFSNPTFAQQNHTNSVAQSPPQIIQPPQTQQPPIIVLPQQQGQLQTLPQNGNAPVYVIVPQAQNAPTPYVQPQYTLAPNSPELTAPALPTDNFLGRHDNRFYFGIGLGGAFVNTKVDIPCSSYYCDDASSETGGGVTTSLKIGGMVTSNFLIGYQFAFNYNNAGHLLFHNDVMLTAFPSASRGLYGTLGTGLAISKLSGLPKNILGVDIPFGVGSEWDISSGVNLGIEMIYTPSVFLKTKETHQFETHHFSARLTLNYYGG